MAKISYGSAVLQNFRDLLAIVVSGQNPDGTPFAQATRDSIADSQIGSGVVTAPAAAAVIASIAAGALPAGKYNVRVSAGVSGSAVADLSNMELQRGGVDLVSPLPDGGGGQDDDIELLAVDLNGAQALEVKAIAVGTAGIEYAATIIATRVE